MNDESGTLRRLTLSILNCVIRLRSSVYPGQSVWPHPRDVWLSDHLQALPWPVGDDIRRGAAVYLAIFQRQPPL